ncbi:drug/metabolite transporter (DMT)-like permease [Rubricella aquisinus]|uniref:Drug/metabolite transporter (DMT)-like permease n=1 Tax=Rubricella aquisinus TaxID=2028108 RepID=A0A840X2M5_9RHOB|nr:DMT family transporter [Rubricella aquisinus]MBB5516096.1 drug/metabolite transporter (DMT)-like permease [Rubricella aquisinus]
MKTDWISWAGVLSLSIMWGSAFALTDVALGGAGPEVVAFSRIFLAAIVITSVALLTGKGLPRTLEHWGWCTAVGLLSLALPFMLISWAQQTLASSITGVLIGAAPLFILLLARLILKEAIRPRQWIGFVVGVIGIAVLSGIEAILDGAPPLPQLAVIAAALCYAGSSVTTKVMPPLHPFSATAAGLIVATLMLAPFGASGFVTALPDAPHGPLMAILALGLVQTGAAQILRYYTVKRSGPVFMSMVSYLIPIWAALLGVTFLSEPITLRMLAGSALILSGLFIARNRPKRD